VTTIVKDDGEAAPRVHALVIGVGGYKHLKGGPAHSMKLKGSAGQLTSTTASAMAFTDWLLSELRYPDVPVGTVELFLSPVGDSGKRSTYTRPDTGAVVDVDRATFGCVESAMRDWFDRLDAHEQNVAFFFFAGHGFGRGDNLALLLEDFGAWPPGPFKEALDFQANQTGMDSCRARRQYYFVDACRTISPTARHQLTDQASTVLPENLSPYGARTGTTLYSTAGGMKAYGQRDGVTHFTEALLAGLRGLGSEQDDYGNWRVVPGLLQNAVQRTLDHAHEHRGLPKQEVAPGLGAGEDPLNLLEGPPRIPLTLKCDPGEALLHATLRVDRANGQPEDSRGPGPRAWTIELDPDHYCAGAAFPSGRYEPKSERVLMATPRQQRVLTVSR
jgi:hypothetical protein